MEKMNNKKVIYSYIGNNTTRHFVDYLKKNANWDPILFHGILDRKGWQENTYPDAKVINSTEMRKGLFDYLNIGEEQPIDAEIIKNLAPYESNFLSWLPDTTGWNFSFMERRRFYYDVLKYWNTVIQNQKPDIFVALSWPHVPSDYGLYLLCKYHYNIPVLYLDGVPHFDKYYFTVGSSMEELSEPFIKHYKSDESLELSKTVKDYLKKLRSEEAITPVHISSVFERLNKVKNKRFKSYIQICKALITGSAYHQAAPIFKKNQKPWGLKSSLTTLDFFLLIERHWKKSKQLKKIYEQLVSPPIKNQRYIYFAAPYQPEALSNIMQGAYEDPFLILDILCSAIPKNWKIYYKEHPSTFKDTEKGVLYKDEEYYKKLKSYSNVVVISTEIHTFDLIDQAEAVATTGGTVGWEAVVRGKPALVFGSIWYQGCKSVFTIKAYRDAVDAVAKIVKGYVPDKLDVDRYAQSIYLASEKVLNTDLNYHQSIDECDDPIYEMERIAKLFLKTEKKLFDEGVKD
jgi:hypothetical protein